MARRMRLLLSKEDQEALARERFEHPHPRVQQRMEYRLKFGPLGSLLDAAIVRRRWRAGVTLFLRGLKQLAERGPDTVGL